MNGPLCAVPVVTTLSSDDRASVRGPCGRSWVAPGALVGGPGPLMGPQWAVLGCSWGLSGRSWAAPGASVVGPRPLLAAKWPFLERERDLGEGQASQISEASEISEISEASYPFFLIDMYVCVYIYIYIYINIYILDAKAHSVGSYHREE